MFENKCNLNSHTICNLGRRINTYTPASLYHEHPNIVVFSMKKKNYPRRFTGYFQLSEQGRHVLPVAGMSWKHLIKGGLWYPCPSNNTFFYVADQLSRLLLKESRRMSRLLMRGAFVETEELSIYCKRDLLTEIIGANVVRLMASAPTLLNIFTFCLYLYAG